MSEFQWIHASYLSTKAKMCTFIGDVEWNQEKYITKKIIAAEIKKKGKKNMFTFLTKIHFCLTCNK